MVVDTRAVAMHRCVCACTCVLSAIKNNCETHLMQSDNEDDEDSEDDGQGDIEEVDEDGQEVCTD